MSIPDYAKDEILGRTAPNSTTCIKKQIGPKEAAKAADGGQPDAASVHPKTRPVSTDFISAPEFVRLCHERGYQVKDVCAAMDEWGLTIYETLDFFEWHRGWYGCRECEA